MSARGDPPAANSGVFQVACGRHELPDTSTVTIEGCECADGKFEDPVGSSDAIKKVEDKGDTLEVKVRSAVVSAGSIRWARWWRGGRPAC